MPQFSGRRSAEKAGEAARVKQRRTLRRDMPFEDGGGESRLRLMADRTSISSEGLKTVHIWMRMKR